MMIEATRYESYEVLNKAEGLALSEKSKNNIISQFTRALSEASGKPNTIDWLYDRMPDFVLQQRDKNLLIDDLTTLLSATVNESGINEEALVLKIISAFNTTNKADQDLLLMAFQNRCIGDKTIFEVLYKKMNDWGGADNFTKAITEIYKIWAVSKAGIKQMEYTFSEYINELIDTVKAEGY